MTVCKCKISLEDLFIFFTLFQILNCHEKLFYAPLVNCHVAQTLKNYRV